MEVTNTEPIVRCKCGRELSKLNEINDRLGPPHRAPEVRTWVGRTARQPGRWAAQSHSAAARCAS
jgi:hypothetical protein